MKLWFMIDYDPDDNRRQKQAWCFACAVNEVVRNLAPPEPKIGQNPPVPKCDSCKQPF